MIFSTTVPSISGLAYHTWLSIVGGGKGTVGESRFAAWAVAHTYQVPGTLQRGGEDLFFSVDNEGDDAA